MALIEWIQWTERAVGQNHATLEDVVNRPLRQFLEAIGIPPDSDITGASIPAPGSVPWANITGTPTSISGYGILDAYTKSQIDALLAVLAPLASPAFTGSPTAPTQAALDASTKLATTEYVDDAVAAAGGGGASSGGYGGEHAGTTDIEVWYAAMMGYGDVLTTSSLLFNTLRVVPFIAPARGGTLDRIAAIVGTGVGSNLRIGLYSSKSATNIYPDALLEDSGDISTSTSGAKEHSISRALTAGRVYWLALVQQNNITMKVISSATGYRQLLGFSSSDGGVRTYLQTAHTFGALPATFPASATSVTSGVPPALLYRFSA